MLMGGSFKLLSPYYIISISVNKTNGKDYKDIDNLAYAKLLHTEVCNIEILLKVVYSL